MDGFALPLVIYREFNNRIWVQLRLLEKSHISFPNKSLIKLKYRGMRRVSGEEGKKSQGQEICQTLTQRPLMQLISTATLLPADTMGSIDMAKVTSASDVH